MELEKWRQVDEIEIQKFAFSNPALTFPVVKRKGQKEEKEEWKGYKERWPIIETADGTRWLCSPTTGDRLYDVTGCPRNYIICAIHDGTYYNWSRYTNKPDKTYSPKEFHGYKWSWLFDGKHVLALCAWKPKMTYGEIRNVILNEGGTIDKDGIIHKPQPKEE